MKIKTIKKQTAKKKRYGFVLVVMLVAMFLLPTTAMVPECGEVMPLFESISTASVDIVFDGTTGVVGANATKQSTATSISGTLTLFEEMNGEWIEMDSWYKSVSRGTLAINQSFDADNGVRYKAVFDIVAYTGTTPEYFTCEHIETCP